MSGYTEQQLKDKLLEKLAADHVEVVDQSDGCGGKFAALIVSRQFEGKPSQYKNCAILSLISINCETHCR